MTRKKSRARSLAAVAALAAVAFTSCDELADYMPTSDSRAEGRSSQGGAKQSGPKAAATLYNGLTMNEDQARLTLDVLPVSDERSMKGYSREKFPHWLSAEEWGWRDVPDANDCDVRDAALSRDGQDVVPAHSTCYPRQGTWTDPYTREVITDPAKTDLDHVVPLAAAWRAGADEWTEEQRTIFSNSSLGTVISGASSNREKGDKGPEAWKPDNRDAWCPYAIRWISVKNEYGLNMTSTDERDALGEMLDTCSGRQAA